MAAEKVLEIEINPAGTIGAGTIEEIKEEIRVWEEAMANDPSKWSEELKTQLLGLKSGSTIEEIAKEISKLRLWLEEGWPPTDSDELPEELKDQINQAQRNAEEKEIIVLDQNGDQTILRIFLRSSSKEASVPDTVRLSRPWNSDYEVLGTGDTLKLDVTLRDSDYQQLFLMRSSGQVGLVDQVIATEPQPEASAAARKSEDNRIIQELIQKLKTREREKTWAQAEMIDPDEWSEELKAELLKLNPDMTIEEIVKEIRKRRLWRKVLETAAMTDPGEWSEELKTQLLARWPDNTIEEIAKRVHKRQKTAAIFIVLDQDGNMTLNKESVTFATLKEELQAKRQLHDNTATIVIQGDEGRRTRTDCSGDGDRPSGWICRSGHRHGTATPNRMRFPGIILRPEPMPFSRLSRSPHARK